MDNQRLPLYYTFGNHMHWVDMEWLWGYQVLPDSIRDMLYFCAETGAKGNINFDAIGYEKLAIEAPQALGELRQAVAQGQIEVVGASYGQPYGLFHGGESNVRQRTYGVRTVMRLLGVRPRTFWEEEFDFCPQLPQILRGVGFDYASLFFQWTWHTPELPREPVPAIWWEGMDGSRLLTAPRNALNLHQWPEDFAGLLESRLLREMPVPGIVQWLELMPSPDWMCRAELLLPQLRALLNHPDFEIRCVTLSEYLEAAREHAQPRRYTLNDVFHGMSLGKNADRFRRLSREGEQSLLTAEALSSLAGLFGRPYPSWSVYPTWELEEAWRELLSAQHHDNDECEGICGFIGLRSYERSLGLSRHVTERTLRLLADRSNGQPGRVVAYNPLGWSRDAVITDPHSGGPLLLRDLPPFGFRVLEEPQLVDLAPAAIDVLEDDQSLTLRRGSLSVTVDRSRGVIVQLRSAEFPDGALQPDAPLADLEMIRGGESDRFSTADVQLAENEHERFIRVQRSGRDGAVVHVSISLAHERDAVDVHYTAEGLPRPDGRLRAALQTMLAADIPGARLIHDHAYGVSEIDPQGTYLRKYPTGDWMTSQQEFEEVHNPFTALQLLDFDGRERGLLYLHDGSQAMLRDGERVRNILTMYDPWDQEHFFSGLDVRVRLVPHGPLNHAQRWRLAQEFTRPALAATSMEPAGDLPAYFGPVWCDAEGTVVSAFFRETEESGANLKQYAGAGMQFPYVLRVVELNGAAITARIRVPHPVAAAFRTNLLGEVEAQLAVSPAEAPVESVLQWSEIALDLRPYEIATIYLDLVIGRKISRNLDEYRSVWATIHRVGEDRG